MLFCLFTSGRAHGNIGLAYESCGRYDEAVTSQLKHLAVSMEMNDITAMTLAYSCLGKSLSFT